jgi:hypothetical protein
MGFNSAFKGLKMLKPRERAFKQFKWPRPQCVNRLSFCFRVVRPTTRATALASSNPPNHMRVFSSFQCTVPQFPTLHIPSHSPMFVILRLHVSRYLKRIIISKKLSQKTFRVHLIASWPIYCSVLSQEHSFVWAVFTTYSNTKVGPTLQRSCDS